MHENLVEDPVKTVLEVVEDEVMTSGSNKSKVNEENDMKFMVEMCIWDSEEE